MVAVGVVVLDSTGRAEWRERADWKECWWWWWWERIALSAVEERESGDGRRSDVCVVVRVQMERCRPKKRGRGIYLAGNNNGVDSEEAKSKSRKLNDV